MKKILLGVGIVVLAAVGVIHWYLSNRERFTTEPEYDGLTRRVVGNTLVSDHDPAGRLRFSSEFRYLGGQKFILYGVADTEQYFFVETTPDDVLKSVYWIQYEAYLPRRGGRYHYDDSPLRVTLGGLEFFTDTEAFHFDPDRKRKRGTDGSMAREYLARHGYRYPDEVLYARLVYLPDESRRKELMVIFMDDLESYGVTAADLGEGGSQSDRWKEIERAHLDRIRATLTVDPGDGSSPAP